MVFRLIANLILGALLIVCQLGLVSALPSWAGRIDLALVALVFILVLQGKRTAILWAMGVGAALETFSFLPPGTVVIGLLAAVSGAGLLAERYLTNRSLYAFLVLAATATIIDRLVLVSLSFIAAQAGVPTGVTYDRLFLSAQLGAILANAGVTVLAYWAVQLFTNTFKPVFLRK